MSYPGVNWLTMSQSPGGLFGPATHRSVWLLAALPPLFWAGNFLIARLLRDAVPPFQMSFWRWVVALLILLPFAWPQVKADLPGLKRDAPFLAVLGLIGVTAFNCLVYVALHHTTVVNAALINSLMPVATFLFALLILHEHPTGRQFAGIAVSFVGAAAIIARGDVTLLLSLTFNQGDLLVVAGLTFWALYTVLIRWRPPRLAPLAFLAGVFAWGILFHLPLLAWEVTTIGSFVPSLPAAAGILYFAVFPSLLAYIFWNRAVAALGPGRTGMFMHLMPIFSAILGVSLLDEPFLAYHAVGIALIIGGITLVNARRA
jgi:drug/metabolite transporter (DMT)-like permease